ncbi:hypothetical protein B9Z65_8631 [Elsinoe australis]|uniref:Uncharacterized protein n=1 Tax=Elsinoe australis TaxID=40998 RepID=A0A2P7YEB1_9PEZI|nr:hypothetical protein B9Z65_8631 [Elsinoe australis]
MASGLAFHNLNTNVNPLLSNPPARASIQAPKPEPEPAAAAPAPKKPTWQASAARPNLQPKKNGGQGHAAAAAAKALSGHSRLQKQGSASSLTLSNFPMPGQAMASMLQQRSADGLLTPDNEKQMMGLGIHQSRSMAQLTVFSNKSGASSARSINSDKSGSESKKGNSLGNGVGFTFKNTTNFVHPNRQAPRTHTPLSRSQNASQRSLTYEEEDDDVVVERMNSVTSDGGWKSGWSVNGGSVSGPSTGPNGELLEEKEEISGGDLAPEDMPATIIEEQDDLHDGERSPGRTASPARLPTPPNDSSSQNSSKSGRSLRSRKSSLSMRLRAKDSEDNGSAPTSPVRSSFDRALNMLGRSVENEDPVTRRASIAAARRAFEEKEAAKDRMFAEKEAKREERRRKSDAHDRPLWRRRPSNAVDSAVDSAEEKSPTYQVARSNSIARNGSIVRTGSLSRSNSINFSRPLFSPAEEDDIDPLSRVPEQESTPESAEFPAYQETEQPNHSLFSAAYQEDAQDGGLFPPMRATPDQEQEGGLFPPPAPIQQGAIYNINGKMYDEYGMPIHQVVLPGHGEDGDDSSFADSRGRRLSKTKQAKGKLSKFSAWSKTRMLRV